MFLSLCFVHLRLLFTSPRPSPASGEEPGGREQEAGHEAEDPEGAGGLRREDRQHREADGGRAAAADRQLAPRPGEAAGGAAQEPGGGG